MGICYGCGGIIGKDCFNPQECVEITQQMARDSSDLDRENHLLKEEIQELKRLLVAHGIFTEVEL